MNWGDSCTCVCARLCLSVCNVVACVPGLRGHCLDVFSTAHSPVQTQQQLQASVPAACRLRLAAGECESLQRREARIKSALGSTMSVGPQAHHVISDLVPLAPYLPILRRDVLVMTPLIAAAVYIRVTSSHDLLVAVAGYGIPVLMVGCLLVALMQHWNMDFRIWAGYAKVRALLMPTRWRLRTLARLISFGCLSVNMTAPTTGDESIARVTLREFVHAAGTRGPGDCLPCGAEAASRAARACCGAPEHCDAHKCYWWSENRYGGES